MAYRLATTKLTTILIAATMGLSACEPAASPDSQASSAAASQAGNTPAEIALRQQAKAMQRSVVEGAVAGAALSFLFADRDSPTSLATGIAAGAAAGGYVGQIQKRHATQEARLEAVKSDLDESAQEMLTTINVMREVLNQQRSELATIRANAAAGAASSGQVNAEVQQARANIAVMQSAINGAQNREKELGSARGLRLSGPGQATVNAELASLSRQVAEMRAIASELSTEI